MYFTPIQNTSGDNPLDKNPCDLLDFTKIVLEPGQKHEGNTAGREALLVILNGTANVSAGGVDFGLVGGRPNVFAGKPHSIYMPPECNYQIEVPSDGVRFEAAVPMAAAEDGSPPFLIQPDLSLIHI